MSGVSLSTVRRAESGRISELAFGHLLKILRAGGMLDGVADLVIHLDCVLSLPAFRWGKYESGRFRAYPLSKSSR
ncbi:MAG: hypothetical protein IJ686_06440 [Bacteroidales bacterium]|nr:hypothetical protein [Bacteroidales bacterium]